MSNSRLPGYRAESRGKPRVLRNNPPANTHRISKIISATLVNHAKPRDTTVGYVIFGADELRAAAKAVADRIKALCEIPEPAGANVPRLAHSVRTAQSA
jgi:hypothetical protein